MRYLAPLFSLLLLSGVSTAQDPCTPSVCDPSDRIRTVVGDFCVSSFDSDAEALACAVQNTPNVRSTLRIAAPIELPWSSELDFDGQTVFIDRPVQLRGNGSVIRVRGNTTALSLTTDADLSHIQDLSLQGGGRTEGVGIHVEAHGVHIWRLHVLRLAIGVEYRSGSAYPGSNANYSRITHMWAGTVGTAVSLSGPDSNGGLFSGIECRNAVTCVQDHSFLGNTWLGLSSNGVSEWGFDSPGRASYPLVLGMYVEGLDALNIEGSHALVVGGNAPTRISEASRTEVLGYRRSRARFSNGTTSVLVPGWRADRALEIDHVADNNRQQVLLRHSDDTWRWTFNGNARVTPYGWTSYGHADGPGIPFP